MGQNQGNENSQRDTANQQPLKDIEKIRIEKERELLRNEEIQLQAGVPSIQFHSV